MKRSPRFLVFGSVVIVLVMVGVGTSAAVTSADGASSLESVSQAAGRVSGRADAKLVPSSSEFTNGSGLIDEYVDQERGDKYFVEHATGRVRYFSENSAHDRGAVDVGREQILTLANSIANRSYNVRRLDGMRCAVSLVDRGDDASYSVRYDEYIGVVRTFNYLHLELTTDGRLASSLQQDEPVTVSLEPKISADVAVRAVAERSGFLKWASESAELVAFRSPDGKQSLTWEVTIRTGRPAFGSTAWARVDAQTGAVMDYATTD